MPHETPRDARRFPRASSNQTRAHALPFIRRRILFSFPSLVRKTRIRIRSVSFQLEMTNHIFNEVQQLRSTF